MRRLGEATASTVRREHSIIFADPYKASKPVRHDSSGRTEHLEEHTVAFEGIGTSKWLEMNFGVDIDE